MTFLHKTIPKFIAVYTKAKSMESVNIIFIFQPIFRDLSKILTKNFFTSTFIKLQNYFTKIVKCFILNIHYKREDKVYPLSSFAYYVFSLFLFRQQKYEQDNLCQDDYLDRNLYFWQRFLHNDICYF